MGGGGLVLVDTAVSTVGAAAVVGSLVHLAVRHNEVLGVHGLDIGVGLSVTEEGEELLGSLLGPLTLGGVVLLGLAGTSNTTVEAGEGDDILVSNDVLEVGLSLAEGETAEDNSSGA